MSKKQNNLALGISESEKVDEYLDLFVHPLLDAVKYLRQLILKIDKTLAKEFIGMSPTFFYAGAQLPLRCQRL